MDLPRSPEWQAYLDGVEAGTIVPLEGDADNPIMRQDLVRGHASINLHEILEAIEACPDRGPVIQEGCQCRRTCNRGYGYNPDGLPVGIVMKSDCWDCVSA